MTTHESLHQPIREKDVLRAEMAEAMQQLSGWIKTACIQGEASVDSFPGAPITVIRLSEKASDQFLMGIIHGRAFIAVSRPKMRWLHRLPWARLSLHASRGDSGLTYGHLELDVDAIRKHTRNPLPGMTLMIVLSKDMARALMRQACLDVRLHSPEENAITSRVFASIPVCAKAISGFGAHPDPYPKKVSR